MYFKGDYLRVLTPRTIDGINISIVDGQQQFKEAFLPVSAKKNLDRQNRVLPKHLQKKIEVVSTNAPQPIQEPAKPEVDTTPVKRFVPGAKSHLKATVR